MVALWKANYQEIGAAPRSPPAASPSRRRSGRRWRCRRRSGAAVCEEAWRRGGIWFLDGTFTDAVTSPEANAVIADFVRAKIGADRRRPGRGRQAEAAARTRGEPSGVPVGSDYYETYNRPNVSLVDLRADPIEQITPRGIRTRSAEHPLDVIVYATGFDALTGSARAARRRGPGRRAPGGRLGRRPAHLPRADGPAASPTCSPSPGRAALGAVTNMPVVDRAARRVDRATASADLRAHGHDTIEATPGGGRRVDRARAGGRRRDAATPRPTVLVHGRQHPRQAPGVPALHRRPRRATGDRCERSRPTGTRGSRSAARCLRRPAAGWPWRWIWPWRWMRPRPRWSRSRPAAARVPELTVAQARQLDRAAARGRQRHAGPVARHAGTGRRRLDPGPRPAARRASRAAVIVYYHGGGWVLGGLDECDRLGRGCWRARTGCAVVCRRLPAGARVPLSRPPSRTPGRRCAGRPRTRGDLAAGIAGEPVPLIVAGESAGGNLAAVMARRAAEQGGPAVALQVLICPVTDCDTDGLSYTDPANQLLLDRDVDDLVLGPLRARTRRPGRTRTPRRCRRRSWPACRPP